MAYASRVYFIFKSPGSGYYKIDILQDGFAGTRIRRNLGGDPILRREQNGDVHGSSLEFYAECEVDGEFSFLYTANPVELKVQLSNIMDPENPDNGDLIWEGFVVTEQYSEPFIDPPYDVRVIATDGLGELKYSTYNPTELNKAMESYTVSSALEFVLSKTGHTFPLLDNLNSIIYDNGGQHGRYSVMQMSLRISGFAGQSYYDILTAILTLLHARIFLGIGEGALRWWIIRETDIANYTQYFNVLTCTRMGGHGTFWPEGALQLSVEAAKSGVTLTASDEVFESMPKTGMQRFVSGSDYYARILFRKYTSGADEYSPLLTYNKTQLSTIISNNTSSQKNVSYALLATYNSVDYYYNGSTWQTTETYLSLGTLSANAQSQRFEVELKARMIPSAWGAVSVYVYIKVASSTIANVNVEDISLGLLNADAVITGLRSSRLGRITECVYPYNLGRKDVLKLSNSARFAESDINLPIVLASGSMGTAVTAAIAIGKLLKGELTESAGWFSSNDGTLREYISLLARDYALSFAQPRRRLQGTLHSDYASEPDIFIVRFPDNIEYLVETFNWNLRSNDVEFSAISLPATSITVASEEITYTD